MKKFIKGLVLCEQFFEEVAKPILDKEYPTLRYSAGLIGYGSDVLGYDDSVSTDHMWGPRFYLFLEPQDKNISESIYKSFSQQFPYVYKGYSVNFSKPNLEDHGVRSPEWIESGEVSPLIFIHTFQEFTEEYLGIPMIEDISTPQWLTMCEHRLLAMTSGKLFHDDLEIKKKLMAIIFYPDAIKKYLIASQWSLIAEEQAFVKRTGQCGDDIGSRIICARIVERLMRLGFLYSNKYAPYSKWFGTAFERLAIEESIKEKVRLALNANELLVREQQLVEAQVLMAQVHNESGITETIDIQIQPYFSRDIKVIFADQIASKICECLKGTDLEHIPLIGTFSQVGNLTKLYDSNETMLLIRSFYNKSNPEQCIPSIGN